MAISDLSSEEKIKLSKQYAKLNDIVKQREELDTKMIPLYDKLSKLEEEEEKLNKEYNDILSLSNDSLTSEHTLRLSNITSRNVEISNDKEAVKKEMIGLSDSFFNIRKEESNLKEDIQNITRKKEGSIFSENDQVVILDKKGNIVDKINVDSSNFSKIITGVANNINKSKNSITKSSNKVVSVIKSNYKSTKPFTYNLSGYLSKKLSKFASNIKSKTDQITQEFKKGYHEEEERVQNIINHYNKIKEENEKVEEEASNLKFISDNKPKEINIDEVVSIVETNSEVNENTSSEEALNIFGDINNFETELKDNKPEIIDILQTKKDQLVNPKNDKIAKSDQNKKYNMMTLFETGKKAASSIGKVAASISNNRAINNAKREAIRELDEKNRQEINEISNKYKTMRDELEEQKREQIQKSQDNYSNQIDNIENIFSGKSVAA